MTLEAYLNLWLETYIRPNRATNTEKAYRYAFAHLSRDIMQKALDDLAAIDLQREFNRIAQDTPRQSEILFAGMRAALHRAELLRMIDRSPMALCDCPTHRKKEICYLLPEEARAYLSAAKNIDGGEILALMLCLGLRRNEARGLRWKDIDGNMIHVRNQRIGNDLAPLKTAASVRDLPLPEGLKLTAPGNPNDFLFPYSETELRRRHLRILKMANIGKPVTLHGLRHSCATTAIISGNRILTVQHLLGHAHYSTTADTYCHVDLAEIITAAQRIFESVCPSMAC